MQAAAELFVPAPIMETAAGKAAKRNVLRMAQRYSATSGSYRCTACRSRCSVQVEYDDAGNIVHSSGHCRTTDCIAWEE